MNRSLEIQSSAEGNHPLVAETRHRAHAVLTQPGFVEKAGWYVERGAETLGSIMQQGAKAVRRLMGPLGSATGELLRGSAEGLGSLTHALLRKK
ncbi:hypothetical protein A2635_03555 [Candidatus Peribacteria bacterium RIFCSPHIGHO2_01_FULL_51_9]|nr:MAG: hypothetical protein A2635_03555 [Candidatus Peribacteria bacterium RIFCSPHIGHO2_01_FULL_51_9]